MGDKIDAATKAVDNAFGKAENAYVLYSILPRLVSYTSLSLSLSL